MHRSNLTWASLFLLLSLSCNPGRNSSLNPLAFLYDGKFSLSNGTRNNLEGHKENFVKLISSNNRLIDEGWILPNAMANNCSIVLFLSSPIIFKGKQLLEVELQNEGFDPFLFRYEFQELEALSMDYKNVETVIKEFVETAKENNLSRAKTIGYPAHTDQQDRNFALFLESFREEIPDYYKETKLVGYTTTTKGTTKKYLVDAIMVSENNIQKLISVSLTTLNNEIKIKEIKF
jgi:hypothetical protein